jgi:DNA-3-methyladenine glycosylase II
LKQITYKNDSEAVKYLIKKDPKLETLFSKKDEIVVTLEDDYFVSLARTIISQQLSSKVVQTIFRRFAELLGQQLTPERVLDTPDEDFRPCGLSYQKIKYLRSLSSCVLNKTVDLNKMTDLSNDEIIKMLVQVHGIGVWSAQMFLMFSLGREDVFSVLDLGLRNAIKKIYGMSELTPKQIEKMSETWSPYRSIVAHFLWHAWDNTPL